jgi:3-hydroxybutyryl-CoA dehydratase
MTQSHNTLHTEDPADAGPLTPIRQPHQDLRLYFDDLSEGQVYTSLGRTITESDIVNFAGLSGDFNPIHMDHEFAAKTPFRRPIAHGLLVVAIGSGLTSQSPPLRVQAFLGIQELKFLEPVFVGDTIRVLCTVLSKEPTGRGRRGIVAWLREVYNQHGKKVQEGVTKVLVEGRGHRAKNDPAT